MTWTSIGGFSRLLVITASVPRVLRTDRPPHAVAVDGHRGVAELPSLQHEAACSDRWCDCTWGRWLLISVFFVLALGLISIDEESEGWSHVLPLVLLYFVFTAIVWVIMWVLVRARGDS